MQNQVIALPRWVKRVIAICADVTMSVLASWLSYCVYFESLYRPKGVEWWLFVLASVLAVSLFWLYGIYRAIFRYSSIETLVVTAKLVAVSAVLLTGMLHWQFWHQIPRSLGVLQPLLFLMLISISRIVARGWLIGSEPDTRRTPSRLLIYGAGMAGVQTSSALTLSKQFTLLGFVDEDPSKVGQTIHGLPVFHPTNLAQVVNKLGITDILLALPNIGRETRREIVQQLRTLPVHTRTLPSLGDLASGRVTVQEFKELEVDDLLWRAAVKPGDTPFGAVHAHRSVLVTGAGGSIGSELCRQILQDGPARLLLLDHSEFALYNLHRELEAVCKLSSSPVELVPLLTSVTNRQRIDWVLRTYQPDTIYHAAAYKHVPMVECNPAESVVNNVFGTLNMAQAAMAAKVQRFILVSTDKAVRPTNVMGASKRMAELVLQGLVGTNVPGHTRFGMVRFGNVLGSSGSVVPLFRSQLALGGPLTITHPEVTRYFMTIPEAVQLVIQAGAMVTGGEVFVLEMGEPVKIIDLARRLTDLSGLQVRDEAHPEGDIEFSFIGLRPGEKLYEELLIGDNPEPTQHPRIMKAHEDFMPWPEFQDQLKQLKAAADAEDVLGIKSVLLNCVSGYHEQPF